MATGFTERGQREVGGGLRDALARLRRRRGEIRAQIGTLEAEDSDLGKIEAAVMAAAEIVARDGTR
jgi:hypothetical protein